MANSKNTDKVNRFYSSANLNYKITDWLNVSYRLGYDTYSENQSFYVNKGGKGGITAVLSPKPYRTTAGTNTVIDHTAMASINKDLNQDFNLTAVVQADFSLE